MIVVGARKVSHFVSWLKKVSHFVSADCSLVILQRGVFCILSASMTTVNWPSLVILFRGAKKLVKMLPAVSHFVAGCQSKRFPEAWKVSRNVSG